MKLILDKTGTGDKGEYPFDSVFAAHGYWLEWLAGLLLVLAVALQLAYFDLATIHPRQLLCAEWHLACPSRDQHSELALELTQIELVQAVVQAHPYAAGALLVQGSLISYRNYALQYPVLELQFFDLTGRLLASRHFQPQEYLLPGADRSAGLPPGVPTPIRLELVDPGVSTLSYEFHLR